MHVAFRAVLLPRVQGPVSSADGAARSGVLRGACVVFNCNGASGRMKNLHYAIYALAASIAFACPDESAADYTRPSFNAALFAFIVGVCIT